MPDANPVDDGAGRRADRGQFEPVPATLPARLLPLGLILALVGLACSPRQGSDPCASLCPGGVVVYESSCEGVSCASGDCRAFFPPKEPFASRVDRAVAQGCACKLVVKEARKLCCFCANSDNAE
jgi:hypothetical protein